MKNKKIIVNKWDTVLIKWIDACSTTHWTDVNEFTRTPAQINSIGMFVGEDDVHWVICLNHDWTNNHMSDLISIPKGMISYVEVLARAAETGEAESYDPEVATHKRVK